jgi:adenylate kinase
MLKVAVDENSDVKGFIFDGFPRTTAQAKALDVLLSEKLMSITATLALEAEDDVLVERLINRGRTSGRIDDQNETKIRNRFVEYNNKTSLLKSFYTTQGKFHSVSGVGGVEEITQRLIELIDGLI